MSTRPRRGCGSIEWALSGDWTVPQASVLNGPMGGSPTLSRPRSSYRAWGPSRGTPVRFRVRIDGQPPGAAHGVDVDDQGNGLWSNSDFIS